MAVIFLQHPLHGAKVACSVQEVEYDKTHGWVEFDPLVAPVEPEAPPQEVNVLRRPGRPRKQVEA